MSSETPPSQLPLIVCLGLVAALAPLSIDMYLPSFPTIREEFATTAAQVQLTLSGYMLGFTLGQLGYGPLSDRFGRRPVLLSGIVLFIVMTILCATASSIESLSVYRFLQAVGGAAGTVLSRAIIRDQFSGTYMARAMSLMLMFILLAPMISPVIGGYLLVWIGWRAIFWMLVICGVLAIVVVMIGVPESLPPGRRSQPGIRALLRGYGRVLTHRQALGYVLSGGISFGALFAFLSGAPFVFIEFYGVAPEHMGYIFTLNVIGVLAGGWLNSKLVISQGVREMMKIGVWLLVAGAAILFVLIYTDVWGVWGVVAGIVVFTLPLNVINANAAAGALEYFPDNAGTASAVVGSVRYGCGAVSGVGVGVLHDGTALPMGIVILGCSALSILFLSAMLRPED
ncbi:MAG: Bcr/CflA family drug resistance efflux transporter [Rhodospirillaceae bacterium TMED63]|nr:Bcr/CflA family drug resistance efflux transporter [Rhodospirillaceae bacterium]RPG03147.1 MAG: Bcr/CflA family drug resistance efflux transporter [Rhodospirillaceae bacterium TMED63]